MARRRASTVPQFTTVLRPTLSPPPRQLGLEVDQPNGFDQGDEIDLVKPFGVGVVTLTLPWSTLEPAGNGYDQDMIDLLQFGMSYYAMHGVHVLLSIPVVDTVSTFVPSDLATAKLDSPAVLARAEALVEKVLAQSGSELEYLVFNNEVDINLADGTPSWSELDALTAAMVAKAHALRPDVKTGISVTSNALTTPNANAIAALATNDVAFVTYYDAGNFGGSSSAGIGADMAAVVAATDRPVVFKEFGYATGAPIGGSEAGQQQFISDAFAAWDTNAARVPLLVYSRMFDGDQTTCEQEAVSYGFGGNQAFISFLCTLGLRTYADAPKAAWATFTSAAMARTFVP
jgi:hypothetical protein